MKSPSNNAPDAPFRASQDRVAELAQAPQDVYIWAHAGGRPDGLDEVMAGTRVPIPLEAATRAPMIQVWEKGGE